MRCAQVCGECESSLRGRLVALLKDLEMGEAALPPGERFDVGILRRELGVRADE